MSQPLILVTPEFGHKSREGMVSLRIGDGPPAVMLPEEAQKIARQLLECAEQAHSETVLMDFFMAKLQMGEPQARATLSELRLHRERLAKAQKRPA